MITRTEYKQNHPDLHEGMTAYTRDGERLGKVVGLEEDSLTVQKGVFFPKDFTLRYDNIVEEHGDDLVVDQAEPELHEWRDAGYAGWSEYDRRSEAAPEADDRTAERTDDRASVELHEEKLETRKDRRRAGEVHVHKVVHTEIRNIEVPVRKEEVVVEREPASGDETVTGEKAFQEEEFSIPVTEEEVEVTKRPVKKGEVHIRKEAHTEKKEVSEELRSEDVEIENEGDVERREE